VDVTIVDLADHTAYLEPRTGTGFLLVPGLSQPVDWEDALDRLDPLGWFLLDDEFGDVETAGHSYDGRLAICIYGDDSIISAPSLADIRAALVALRLAAGIPPDS
jgi:hypothetical protein